MGANGVGLGVAAHDSFEGQPQSPSGRSQAMALKIRVIMGSVF